MNIIDFHVHAFPPALFQAIWKWFDEHGWQIRYKIQADEIVKELTDMGVSRFVLLNYAHKPDMSASLNEWTHAFSQKHPHILPFGAIHPDDKNVSALLDLCFNAYGFHGLKFHTHVSGVRPDEKKMFPIYEKLIEHDRVLLLHAGTGPSLRGYSQTTTEVSGVRFVRNVLKRYPKLKLVIPHLGADEINDFFELMAEFPNLWMDTTMALARYFSLEIPWEQIAKFSDRILYGSDFPNIPYEKRTEINSVRSSNLPQDMQKNILFNNAVRLLKLS